jgi:queuosine precursor transporter
MGKQTNTGDTFMIYSIIFITALVAANLLVALIGPWFSVVNSFLLIGLDLSIRDKLHETWKTHLPLKMGCLILVASAVSYLLNPATGMIAIASFTAFALAMLADTVAYHFLRRKTWLIKSNGSNVAGAAVDSVVFPTIAFGGIYPEIVALQFIAKTFGGFVWSFLLKEKALTGELN